MSTKLTEEEKTAKIIDVLTTVLQNPAEIVKKAGTTETFTRAKLKELAEEKVIHGEKMGRGNGYALLPAATRKARGGMGKRRPEAVARDARVLELVAGAGFTGVSKYDVAESLDLTPDAAYLSLWRLVKAEKVIILPSGTRRPVYATPDALADKGRAAKADA